MQNQFFQELMCSRSDLKPQMKNHEIIYYIHNTFEAISEKKIKRSLDKSILETNDNTKISKTRKKSNALVLYRTHHIYMTRTSPYEGKTYFSLNKKYLVSYCYINADPALCCGLPLHARLAGHLLPKHDAHQGAQRRGAHLLFRGRNQVLHHHHAGSMRSV